jgi:hypothetical protein
MVRRGAGEATDALMVEWSGARPEGPHPAVVLAQGRAGGPTDVLVSAELGRSVAVGNSDRSKSGDERGEVRIAK